MSPAALVVANLAATLFLTGLVWFLQVVQLPLMHAADAKEQRKRNTILMTGPMAVEMISAIWLAAAMPHLVYPALLVAIVWIVTFARIVPLHARLIATGDQGIIAGLIRWNWIRTVCWTLRSAIMLWIVSGAIHI